MDSMLLHSKSTKSSKRPEVCEKIIKILMALVQELKMYAGLDNSKHITKEANDLFSLSPDRDMNFNKKRELCEVVMLLM